MALSLAVNPHDPLPLYAQLERAIVLAITTGALAVGERLPTVRQLAVELKINANTVGKVYAELERQGVLTTRRGVGTFVEGLPSAGQSKRRRAEELRGLAERFLAEAAAKGFAPRELLEQITHLVAIAKEKV